MKKEKEILVAIQTPTYGGPHNQVLRMADLLRESGWKQAVLLPHDSEQRIIDAFKEANVDVELTKISRMRKSLDPRHHLRFVGGFRAQCSEIQAIIERRGSDVVQICGLMTLQPAFAARRAGVPVVWQFLSTFAPEPLRSVLCQVVKKKASVVMTTGEAVARAHRGIPKYFGDRLVPFFAPVDTAMFRFDADARQKVRKALGVPDGAFVIGTVGNQNRQKGHEYFVHAAAEIAAERDDVYFRICGQETAANRNYYKSAVVELARSKGLLDDGRLEIGPPPFSVEETLSGFDLFTLSSRTEGTPTALMEAMSVGLPAVAPDVGSVVEIITDGTDGFVVPPCDPGAIANSWRRLLDDRELQEDFSKRGRSVSVERFDIKICVERHVMAYDMAFESRGR